MSGGSERFLDGQRLLERLAAVLCLRQHKPFRLATEGSTPEDLAQELRLRGVPARVLSIGPEDLTALRVPTLIFLRDQHAVMLRRVNRRGAEIERADRGVSRMSAHELARCYGGRALELGVPCHGNTSFRARVLGLLLDQRAVLLQSAGFALFLSLFAQITAIIPRFSLDTALADRSSGLLITLGVAAAAVALLSAYASWLRESGLRGLRSRLAAFITNDVFGRMVKSPFPALIGRGLGPQLQALDCAESIVEGGVTAGTKTLLDALLALAALIGIFWLLPSAALLCALLSLGAVLVSVWTATRYVGLQGAQVEASERQQSRLYELIHGVVAYRAAGAERHGVRRWLSEFLDERSVGLVKDRLLLRLAVLLDGISQVSSLCVLAVGGDAALRGTLSLGAFITSSMLGTLYASAARSCCEAIVTLRAVGVHATYVERTLEERSPPPPLPVAGESEDTAAVVMTDVWFRYSEDGPWILRGYNLRASRFDILQLNAASGAGKSTILRLIAGLYRPTRGSISVFGRDPQDPRVKIAYLPQTASPMGGSILSNLRVLSRAPDERIGQAALQTGLMDWVLNLPMGLETILPPGGGNLSGGQRQSILLTAIAAAEAHLTLVDEGTSHFDVGARRRLDLPRLFAGRTVIIVSHDQ